MADRYLLEASGVDGFLLEDGSGVLLLEATAGAATDEEFPYIGGGFYPFRVFREWWRTPRRGLVLAIAIVAVIADVGG